MIESFTSYDLTRCQESIDLHLHLLCFDGIWQLLQEWYAQSFRDLCEFEGRHGDTETLLAFCQTLQSITKRHENVVQTMAQGVLELKDSHAVDIQTEMSIQYFLDRFYMSRIR